MGRKTASNIFAFALLVLQFLVASTTWCSETYLKPTSLIAAKIEHRADAHHLLQSSLFRHELMDLAKRADLKVDDAIREDDKIAIASFHSDFQRTHELIAK